MPVDAMMYLRNNTFSRGHAGDVQDIAWAPDSSALMSGSIENICIMWDVEGTSRKCRLEDHRNYVQVSTEQQDARRAPVL